MSRLKQLTVCLATLVVAAGVAAAADNKLMHCFTFTALEGATDADFQAFYNATDALPGKIPGLSKVWYGKLARPLPVFMPNRDTGQYTRVLRQYGVCMEFQDQNALKAYAAHPAHKEWEAVYDKVRVHPTTTYDIVPAK